MNPEPPVPPRRKPGPAFIAIGIAFLAIGSTNHTMRSFIGVGVVFIVLGIRRIRADKPE